MQEMANLFKEICKFQWLDLLIKHGYFTIIFYSENIIFLLLPQYKEL